MSRLFAKMSMLREGGWVATGQVFAAGVQIISLRLQTEFVTPDVFAQVTLFLGLSTFAYSISCGPLLNGLLRFYPEAESDRHVSGLLQYVISRMKRWLGLGGALLLGTSAVMLSLGQLSAWDVAVIAGILVVDACRMYQVTLLSAQRAQRAVALITMSDIVMRSACAILSVALIRPSTTCFLVGTLAGSSFVVAGFLAIRRSFLNANPALSALEILPVRVHEDLRRYMLPLYPLAIVGWMNALSDRYVISGVLGLREAGVYAASYALVSRLFLGAHNIVLSTVRPNYFEAVAKGSVDRAKVIFRGWVLTTVSFCAILSVIFLVLPEGFSYLLGERFKPGIYIMKWFALGYSLVCVSQIFNIASLARKRSAFVLWSEAAGTVGLVVVGVPLTMRLGLSGAAMAVPFYFGIQFIASVVLARVAVRNAEC